MSSYGHPRPPHRGGDEGYDGYDQYTSYSDSYADDSYGADPYPADSYAEPPTRPRGYGAAGVPASPAPPPRTPGASGRARAAASVPVASASAPVVPPETQPGHRYDWAGAGGQRPAGRASVPVSPAGGAGASGRASVRPGGPGKPGGPGGTGPDGGPGGTGPGDGRPKRKKKRHWLRNSLLCTLAVIIITVGGGMVALSFYVDGVLPPELTPLAEGSTIRYSDGRQMAELQDVNREIIDTQVPELENVRTAVVAAEDKGFYDHSGVDFMGIMRAAWNNFTGGAQQGASTIDQQYAGGAAEIRGDSSYSRKLQEAAMAYKMNQDYSKEEILDFYLNTIYFGRGAYGVEAAAEAYFDKPAAELTLEEAAVIAGCIRLPDDGSGLCPYDPLHTPDDPSAAEFRFRYVLGQAVDMGELDQGTADGMVLPEVIEPPDPDEPFKGPQGNIVRQVERELAAMGITDVKTGGYRITTTINRGMQRAARDAAREQGDLPHWENIPDNVAASLVAVDPATGGVLAYYGGDDGTGIDYAGLNVDEETGELSGGRPPGSTFKIYTLIAEMREGISFNSHWRTSEYDPEWADIRVVNAGRNADVGGCEGTPPDFCTLRWATQQSYNVPFAYFSEAVPDAGDGGGPGRIVQAAMDAGITVMWDTENGEAHDLTAISDVSEVTRSVFDHPVAYGQYPVTVLDHANGVATLASGGVHHERHFVASVEQKVDGEWVQVAGDQISGEERIQPQHAQAITDVLATIPAISGFALNDGRPAAAKTGTWEHPDYGNRDAWVVGYTPQIAAAVWVGDPENAQIEDAFGNPIGSSGLPAQIWKNFMDEAHLVEEYEIAQFPPPPPNPIGDANHPYANGVQPAPEDPENDDPRCQGPFQPFCPDDGDDDDDDETDDTTGGLLPIIPPPGQENQGGG